MSLLQFDDSNARDTEQNEDNQSANDIIKASLFAQKTVQEQDGVFQFVHKKMTPMLNEAAGKLLAELLDPTASTMQIKDETDFRKQQNIITQKAMQMAEQQASLVMAEAKKIGNAKQRLLARRQKREKPEPFSETQLSLIQRARNANMLVLVKYITRQWQMAAMAVLLFATIEREIAVEPIADEMDLFDGYYCSALGYNRNYSAANCAALSSVCEQVAYKIQHAQLGRLIEWAFALDKQMRFHVRETHKMDADCLFAPIYAAMVSQQNDSVASALDFFMRAMYAATAIDAQRFAARETKNPRQTPDSKLLQRFFDARLALAQQNEATREKDATEKKQSAEPVATPHQRNAVSLMHTLRFLTLFDVTESYGSVLGDDTTSRESARCLWVVWLQNAESIYSLAYENDYCAAYTEPGDVTCASEAEAQALHAKMAHAVGERMANVMLHLSTLPEPHSVGVLCSALEEFIDRQHTMLLQNFGFDLDKHGLVQRMRRHLHDLVEVVRYYNSAVLQTHKLDQALDCLKKRRPNDIKKEK